MSIIKKYLKKDVYLQKKDRNYWQSWHEYNSIIMEYQKIIHLLHNAPNQPTKFRKKAEWK